MKNLRILALLLAGVAVSSLLVAKNNDNGYSKKGKRTKSEKIADQEEQWVEGKRSQPVEPSEVRYEYNTGSSRGNNGCCKRKNCNTCSVAPCGKGPVCRKMIPVEAPAEKHEHRSYSYTCPVGYSEITQ
jgi:hypothetical protein